MSTADELLNEALREPEWRNYKGKRVLSTHDIVVAYLTAYARAQKHREKIGVISTTLSREEYERYKLDSSPHWWEIRYAIGSWGKVKKVVAEAYNDGSARRSSRIDDAHPAKLKKILINVAREEGISPHEVSIPQFTRYAKNHPEEKICDWRVYTKYITGTREWTRTKIIALTKEKP